MYIVVITNKYVFFNSLFIKKILIRNKNIMMIKKRDTNQK